MLLSFQRSPDYEAPIWPDGAGRGQQFHIDVTVDNVDEAEQQVLALGATRHEVQPGIAEDANWRVYLDPVGHPFMPLLGLIGSGRNRPSVTERRLWTRNGRGAGVPERAGDSMVRTTPSCRSGTQDRAISASETAGVAVGSTAVLIVVATFSGSHGLV